MDKSKVLYIQNGKKFLYDGHSLKSCGIENSKKYYTAFLLPPSALFVYSQKLPSNLSDEQVAMKMEMGMYDDGGADEMNEYKTGFLRHMLPNEDDDLVDLFGLEENQAKSIYSDIFEQAKAVDLMTPSVFMYESLYGIEEVISTDIYVYLGDEESYGVLYANGKYIAHRNIESLAKISSQSSWDLDTLKANLKSNGINEEKYEQAQLSDVSIIQDLLSRSLERIIHTVNHKRGLFGFDEINNVYVDFEGANIDGLEKIFQAYDVKIDKTKALRVEEKIPQDLTHEFIASRYIYEISHDKHKEINLTLHPRQLPIYKKPVGVLIASGILGLLLVFGYYAYLNFTLNSQEEEIQILDTKIEKAKKVAKKIVVKLKAKKKKLNSLNGKLKNYTNEENVILKSVDKVPQIRSSLIKRQGLIDDCLRGLSQNSLGIVSLEQNGSDRLSLHILTVPQKRENIAKFMDFMIDKGYSRSFTDRIYRQDGLYESIVEVKRYDR